MFDVGFSELVLIGIVALLVLGPERLPKAARFAGLWVRRARAQWHSVKSELERELAAEELKRSLRDTEAAAQAFEEDVRKAQADARREFESMRAQIAGERNGDAGTTAEATADASTDPHADPSTPPSDAARTDDRA